MPVKPLADLAPGARVLVDANIFIYAANGTSQVCLDFLQRCAQQELRGITTLEVLAEVCHRLMLEDALAAGTISRASASLLRRSSGAIRSLRSYWPSMARLLNMNLLLLPLDRERFQHAETIRERYGLLTNDSLVLAAADSYGIRNLATRDDDFDHVRWLTVHKPEDV